MIFKVLLFFLCLLYSPVFIAHNWISDANITLVHSIMEDNFSPPVASRIHLYANAAAYEIYSLKNKKIKSLSIISHLPPITPPIKKIDYDIAACASLVFTGMNYIYTEDKMNLFLEKTKKEWLKTHSTSTIESSVQYGRDVSKFIIEWSKGDNYGYTRTLQRYVLNDSLGAWQPTPAEYKDGLEPNWPLMRQVILPKDSFFQFNSYLAYSEDKNSMYYKNMDTIHKKAKTLTSLEREIAFYWDDNPMTTINKGHTMYVEKKPTPIGHWLKITAQASKFKKMTNEQTSRLFTMVSIAAYDAFINCWYVKYQLNTIRPETYIQRNIDPEFKPIIETPPFPEYPSGHSTVSSSVSVILDKMCPIQNSFTDSSQIMLGMKARSFKSFVNAAREASISRFYGGIHILPALREGERLGAVIGNTTLNKFGIK